MKNVVWGLVILLVILHQDFWFWENDTQIFGFIPLGLFYHALISVGAGVTWYLATVYAWPEGVENVVPEYDDSETTSLGDMEAQK